MEKLSLLDFRKDCGMTQQELANAIGVSRNYIALVENGKKPFSEKLKLKLSSVNNASDNNCKFDNQLKKCERCEELRDQLKQSQEREKDLLEIIKNLSRNGN